MHAACHLHQNATCRYLSAQEDAANPLRRLHRNYDDLSFTVLRKGEEPSLKAPLIVCEVFGQRTEAVLRAIQAVLVGAGPKKSSA